MKHVFALSISKKKLDEKKLQNCSSSFWDYYNFVVFFLRRLCVLMKLQNCFSAKLLIFNI